MESICSKIDGSDAQFRQFLVETRQVVNEHSNIQELLKLSDLLDEWSETNNLSATRRQYVLLYRSLAKWLLEKEFVYPAEGRLQARTQYWELEWHCPIFLFQKQFTSLTFKKFPDLGGFKSINSVYSSISESNSSFVDARFDKDVRIHKRHGAKITLVAFASKDYQFAGIGWTLFDRAVAEPINANLIVFKDFNNLMFLAGIKSVGDFNSSVEYVRSILADFQQTEIVGIAASSGVFALINYGSKVGINKIVALSGPTSLDIGLESGTRPVYKKIKEDHKAGSIGYPDLRIVVRESKIERIDFFVGGRNVYDMEQMEYLSSDCDLVYPHVYERNGAHVVVDLCIADGTLFSAIKLSEGTDKYNTR